MVREKSLLFAVLPLPSKVLLELPAAVARPNEFGAMPGSAGTAALTLPLLSIELVLFWLALTFSTICTVIVSPTRRARWSSNSGRYCADWKIAPLLTTGAATGSGSAAVGSAMSTLGRGFRVEQPARTSAATTRERSFIRLQLAQTLQHLVGGLDRLRVQLVGALG